jgi:methyl-accepting chemotaxis protein
VADITSLAGRRRGPGPAARLISPLFLVVGALLGSIFPETSGAGRWVQAGLVTGCLAVGLGTWRVDWGQLPAWLLGLLPYLGGVLVAAVGLVAPDDSSAQAILLGLVVMYCGVAFDRVPFLTSVVLGSAALAGTALAAHPPAGRFIELVGTLVTTTSIGFALHWLRGLLDAERVAAVQAQAEAARHHLLVEQEREERQLAASRAEAERLAQRARLADTLVAHTERVASVADGVNRAAADTAREADRMATAVEELSENAATVAGLVADSSAQAQCAAGVIDQLAASSASIRTASDLIAQIADRTNLLALNASIEAARTGEAGSGFAVVAHEVKGLAQRSRANAESISGVLAEVHGQVKSAVEAMAEITASMVSLAGHNDALGSAVDDQTASVRAITRGVRSTAAGAGEVAAEVAELKDLGLQGAGRT